MKLILAIFACLACLALASLQESEDGNGTRIQVFYPCGKPSARHIFYNEVLREYYKNQRNFPGTKWCGPGTDAEHDDDLGSAVEEDKCCRAHDWCNDIILAGETKHGLTNDGSYTKLNCKCDCAFKDCLKKANSFTGWCIGFGYFDVVPTKCFTNMYPVKRCVQNSGKPFFRCLAYEVDTTKPRIYQWFDVPLY